MASCTLHIFEKKNISICIVTPCVYGNFATPTDSSLQDCCYGLTCEMMIGD